MVDLSGGDLGPPKQPTEGRAEMGGRIPAGTVEAGDARTLITTPNSKKGEKEKGKNEKGTRKKGEKEKEKNEKGNRKKDKIEKENSEKENGKERKSGGGWRATLLSCFVCGVGGGDSEDEWEISAEEEERMRIEERIRRAREADLERFLKVRKVNIKHRVNFKRMLRRRKMTEANQEWSALPPGPEEEAERKVSFREVDACDVWFYQEEANPRLGQAWKRVLQEIKDNKMARAFQAKWRKKEKQLLKREEKQLNITPKTEEEEIDRICELLMASMLTLGFGVLVYTWYLLSLLE